MAPNWAWQIGYAHGRDIELIGTAPNGNRAFEKMIRLPRDRPEIYDTLGLARSYDPLDEAYPAVWARCVIRGMGREFFGWRAMQGDDFERWWFTIGIPILGAAQARGNSLKGVTWIVTARKRGGRAGLGGPALLCGDLMDVVEAIAAAPSMKPLKNVQVYFVGTCVRALERGSNLASGDFAMRCSIRKAVGRGAVSPTANPCFGRCA